MTEEQQAGQTPQQDDDDRGYTPPEVGDSNLVRFLQENKIDLSKVGSSNT